MAATALDRQQIVSVTCIPIVGALLNGFYNQYLYHLHPALFWLADIALFVVVPISIVCWLAQSVNIHPKNYGLRFPPYGGIEPLITSLLFATMLFGVQLIAWYIGWALTSHWNAKPEFTYRDVLPQGAFRFPVVLYMALTAGLKESIFYIALPWYFWRNYYGLAQRRGLFVCISSAVFAAAHWEQGAQNMIAVFAFGFVACLLYWKVNDLWPVIGAHVVLDVLFI